MQRETRRRIAYYQDVLPDMKKRVAAAALMLLVAAIVSVTAAYAWMTLSIAPVVSSVNTTMSANGTLEIALSNPEGTLPEEHDIDESVEASTEVTTSNLRWGNLVNLSDSSYGIDSLVLRPAQLNTASLKNSPLWGAVYGADGRISTLDSNYTYVKWEGTRDVGSFVYSNEYGVRAIASYKAGASASTSAEYDKMAKIVNDAREAVNKAYQQVPSRMPAMSSMLSSFAQSKIDDVETEFTSAEIQGAYELYETFYQAMLLEKDALVALANFQNYVAAQNDPNLTYVPLTWDDLVANKGSYNTNSTTTKSSNGTVSLVGLTQFISDLNVAGTDVALMEKYYQESGAGSRDVYWSTGGDENHQLSNIVSNLIGYNTMSMMVGNEEVKLVNIASKATDLLGMSGQHTNVYIYDGLIKRFEQAFVDETSRLQGQTNKAVATVKAKKIITITLHGDCYTKAAGPSYFATNHAAALGEKLIGSDIVAEDTYGMAVDFWLRTNAEETYLTLEGAVATDENGDIYSYDGVNRVWGSTGNTALTTNSTTQGGGSCYIYYADTPEDTMRSLQLLRSMKVAFVDKNGTLLALSSMDTDNYYAVNGRITVPLAVESTSGVPYTYVDVDQSEKTGRAVTLMTHDESLWITAIIYLDGAYLTNDHVLAAADIDGQLNIQFGSSVDLNTLGDNKLLTAERSVTASATPTSLDWAMAQNDEDMTTNITVTVDGAEPNTVTAFFVRAINSTQGERQSTMTFTESPTEKGKWTASYMFDAPGVYYLRHVRLDGVDYALENPVMVEVEGFSISEVKWGESDDQAVIYSPDSFYETAVTAKIASNDASKMPKTVQARFLRDDGIMVNVDMRYDPSGKWTGTGTFYRSGTYTLQYMLLDGEYYDVSDRNYSLTLYLGLNVAVYNEDSTLQDEYEAGVTYTKKVGVIISDNDGNVLPVYEYNADGSIKNDANGDPVMLPWVSTVRLRYSPGSSAVNSVDSELVWDDAKEWFTGRLAITSPGRYAFYDVTIDGDSLARAKTAPVFTVMPPDPPRYVTSQSTALQFAPLTNDGYIGPIKIEYSETAALVVELHNSVTNQTYLIPNEAALDTYTDEDENFVIGRSNGTMTYDSGRQSWIVKPVYKSGDTDTQEGVWTVKNIYVWNFMSDAGTLREYDEHDVWSGNAYNFSGLTTEISCSLNVEMVSGTTTMGDASTPFMTDHYVKDIGMKVLMKDNKGRTITGSAMDKMTVKLTVAYGSNTGDNYNAAYGYEVVGWNPEYAINFTYDDANSCWIVNESNSNHNWQYVGEYKVTGLEVKVGSTTLAADKFAGVPAMYTVTSDGPDANNLSVKNISQSTTELGKDSSGNVTGTFLQSYNPGISATLQLTYDNGNKEATYARVEGTEVKLNLTYLDGNNAPNGGYSWTGSSSYSDITMAMNNTNTGTMQYDSGTTPLLSGTYDVSITLKIGDSEKTFTSVKIGETVKTLNDIEVYSVLPSLTVNSYSYDDGTTFNNIKKDADIADSWYDMYNNKDGAALQKNLEPCTNTLTETDIERLLTLRFPVVLISGESSGNVRYGLFYNNSTGESDYKSSDRGSEVMPSISFKLLNMGNVDTNPTITFSGNQTVTWTCDKATGISDTKNIGALNNSDYYSNSNCSGNVYWTKRTKFGSASVDSIKLTNQSVVYTVQLDKKVTINNPA